MTQGWMRSAAFGVGLALAAGCAPERAGEAWADWFDAGDLLDVGEHVAFTDIPYDFPGSEAGVADLPIPANFRTLYGVGDTPPSGCRDWSTTSELPMEIEGMVTAHPRYYFKTVGCVGPGAPNSSAAEKYYGSYFIQDATGGIFVLGDSKVAHFDMGDRVRLRVRATRNRFDLPTLAVHDVIEIKRGPEPIYYEVAEQPFGFDDISQVRRITGEVISEKDTFGEILVEGDDGTLWAIGLDVELNRRGIEIPVGTRIQATGPIMYSYSVFTLVIMKLGQIEILD